jgi:hypothetical protein
MDKYQAVKIGTRRTSNAFMILTLYETQHDLRHIHHSAVRIISSVAYLLLFADMCSLP